MTLCQNDIHNIDNVDNLRNCFMNLAINTIIMTKVFNRKVHKARKNIKAIPNEWKTWDTIVIKNSMTVKEFLEYFLKEYQVKITKIIDCHYSICSSFNEEETLNKKVENLFVYENVHKKCIHLEVNGVIDKTNENVDMPFIEYNI